MKTAFVTACYGAYDDLPTRTPQTTPVDRWVLVTDELDVAAQAASLGWETVLDPRPHMHSNMAAKVPKLYPGSYVPDCDIVVWVDASATIGEGLMARCVSSLGEGYYLLSMLPHAHRQSLADEVVASRGLRKYDGMQLEEQTASYRNEGMPDEFGLWATGCIARNYSVDGYARADLDRFSDMWMAEMVKWSFQDQLSFSYVCWRSGVYATPLASDHCAVPDTIWWRPHVGT